MSTSWLRRFIRSKSICGWLISVAIYGLAITWLYPFAWMVMSSLKPNAEIYNTGLFGGHLSLENYAFLFGSAAKLHRPFLGALGISSIVAVTVTVSVLITSAFIAYALARIKFPFHSQFNEFLLFQMVVPTMMFILPMFVLIRQLGLINSYWALILPYMMSGWGIYMMAQSFKGMPEDYIDAAKLDRANFIQIVTRIIAPLNKSIIAIVALFTFNSIWDNFMWPLMTISDVNKMPLSVLLAMFSKEYGGYVGPVMAGAVLQTLPLVILFIIFRRQFLEGMSLTLK